MPTAPTAKTAKIWSARAGRYYRVAVSAAPSPINERRNAFERIYLPLRARMFAYARSFRLQKADAEDVAAQALLVIMERVDLGREANDPTAFALQTVHNEIRKHHRHYFVPSWRDPETQVTRFVPLPEEAFRGRPD